MIYPFIYLGFFDHEYLEMNDHLLWTQLNS